MFEDNGNKCGKCQNHDFEVLKKGHARDCPFKTCTCLRCRLLDARSDILQVISGKETKLKGTKKDPNCGFCQNHGIKILRKGHVRSCGFGQERHFRLDNCFDCEVHYIRNEVNRLQIKMRRAMKEDKTLSEEQRKTAREPITREEVEKVCHMARVARKKREVLLAQQAASAASESACTATATSTTTNAVLTTSSSRVSLPASACSSSSSSSSMSSSSVCRQPAPATAVGTQRTCASISHTPRQPQQQQQRYHPYALDLRQNLAMTPPARGPRHASANAVVKKEHDADAHMTHARHSAITGGLGPQQQQQQLWSPQPPDYEQRQQQQQICLFPPSHQPQPTLGFNELEDSGAGQQFIAAAAAAAVAAAGGHLDTGGVWRPWTDAQSAQSHAHAGFIQAELESAVAQFDTQPQQQQQQQQPSLLQQQQQQQHQQLQQQQQNNANLKNQLDTFLQLLIATQFATQTPTSTL